MKRLISVFTALFILTFLLGLSKVRAEEGHHSIGLKGGQVGLSGDVGSSYGNALGWGPYFLYAASDYLDFELGYLMSKHTQNNLTLNQSVLSATLDWNFDEWDIFVPYLIGGVEYVMHTQDLPNAPAAGTSSYNTNAFGLDVGLGAKVNLGANVMTGLDFTYHSVFDTSITNPAGTSFKAAQSYYTVLVRFGYAFGGGKR